MGAPDSNAPRGAASYLRIGLACLCAAELGLALALPEGLQTRAARQVAAEAPKHPAADLAIMGDSVAATAINPRVLAAGMADRDWSIGNYSIAGSSPLYGPAHLGRLLAAGCRPKAIVYAPHPSMMATPMVDRFFGRFATFGEIVEAMRFGVELPEGLIGLACRFSYTLRYREEIRACLLDGDFGFYRTLFQPPSPWKPPVHGGEMPPMPEEKKGGPGFAGNIGPTLTRPIDRNPTADRALRKFLERARAEGIPVYWWILPTSESLAKLPGRAGQIARFEAYVEGLERDGLAVRLNARMAVWPDHYFADPWHLGPYGAAVNSRLLLEALREGIPVGAADRVAPGVTTPPGSGL